jgi:hypothetical protein
VQYCAPGAPQALGCAAGQPGAPPQVPFWHATPAGQVLPQPPQFAASVIGSVQYVPPVGFGQAIGICGGQVVPPVVHAPFWHIVPAMQTMPQAPQFPGSFITEAQKVLSPSGVGHVDCGGTQPPEPATHIAATQLVPGPQA